MHVHAINKASKTYEHIDPALVGNERRILVSELSGRSNIVAVATKHNIEDDRELMDKILAEVVRLGESRLPIRKCRGVVRFAGQTCRRNLPASLSTDQVPDRRG